MFAPLAATTVRPGAAKVGTVVKLGNDTAEIAAAPGYDQGHVALKVRMQDWRRGTVLTRLVRGDRELPIVRLADGTDPVRDALAAILAGDR